MTRACRPVRSVLRSGLGGLSLGREMASVPVACATVTRSSREVEAGFQDFATMKDRLRGGHHRRALAVMASPDLTIAPYFGNELVRRRRLC